MPDPDNKPTELVNNDIVFECEYCSKSLAIDYHGAGLTIQCPDCGKDIQVPIPDGVDISDIDYDLDKLQAKEIEEPKELITDEESRKSAEQINNMVTELDEFRFRTRYLEKELLQFTKGVKNINHQMDAIRKALDQITNIADSLTEKSSNDTQELG